MSTVYILMIRARNRSNVYSLISIIFNLIFVDFDLISSEVFYFECRVTLIADIYFNS